MPLSCCVLSQGGGGGGRFRYLANGLNCAVLAIVGCIVQELCENRGGRPGLSVLTSLLVSVDVKIY